MADVKLLMVLSENHSIVDPRDLQGLVRLAAEAEQAGVDGVQMSEHVVLGPSAGEHGIMGNPRDYAAPGQPGSGNTVAAQPDHVGGDRAGDVGAAPRGRRGHHSAAPPPEPCQAVRHLGPAQRGAARRAAHRVAGTEMSTTRWGSRSRKRVGSWTSSSRCSPQRGVPSRSATTASSSPSATSGSSQGRTAPPARCCGSAARVCTSRWCGGSCATAPG